MRNVQDALFFTPKLYAVLREGKKRARQCSKPLEFDIPTAFIE